ncbi:Flp pilus assembly protein CpaB [Paraburkholderia lycopersici]|uniref:Pilus assembly protein CpaB n=1 Tax=Paraburkholderia lycopersici TaxID=416944 RepID=A0A1G7BF66_9BURK|nr:Flp pilus assembly protein CpaB [Paraburkholderia lycopersici]SDE25684.1 pilus assembly protein CpaB [Paraburkholderia lycopersici]
MANLTKVTAGLFIAAALVLGVFAWILARRPPPAAVVNPVPGNAQMLMPVVVAARTLPAGQPIPEDALRVQSLSAHPSGAFSDAALIAGRMPISEIAANSPILAPNLSSSLAASIAPGERAVAVRIDEISAVGYQIRPGNFVDVFFTLRRDGAAGGGEVGNTQTRLLISKARVLVFGNPGEAAPLGGNAQRMSGFNTQNTVPRTTVLAVPVTEIDALELAQSQGQLTLALRNPTDNDVIDPSAFGPYPGLIKISRDTPQASTRAAQGVALEQFAGARAPSATVTRREYRGAALAGAGRIEVIRGGRVETVVR